MAEVSLGAARIFASHYQIVVCDDPWRPLADEENWTPENFLQGFAGAPSFRMVGTEADRNDHWIELYASDQPPLLDEWQRVTCVHFRCSTGKVYVMSVIDQEAPVTADIPEGNYAVYVAGGAVADAAKFVMPGPWSRASTSLLTCRKKDVDGRDKSPAMTTNV
jgi:hypothetical protein